ncbi:MAG: type VII toxin-antitoxin system HepT family RNase toxin [Bacillota bacterium]
MVDKQKVYSKIHSLKTALVRLGELKQLSRKEFLANFTNFDSAKYNLIVAVEAMIDISNHIISHQDLEIPATSADSIKTLVKNGILPIEHQNTFVAMVKFRYKAVHLHYEIKDEEVYQIFQNNLGDFEKFITAILQYVK